MLQVAEGRCLYVCVLGGGHQRRLAGLSEVHLVGPLEVHFPFDPLKSTNPCSNT